MTIIAVVMAMATTRTKVPMPTAGAISRTSTVILDVSVFVSGCSITAKMTFILEKCIILCIMTLVYIQKNLQTVLRLDLI